MILDNDGAKEGLKLVDIKRAHEINKLKSISLGKGGRGGLISRLNANSAIARMCAASRPYT